MLSAPPQDWSSKHNAAFSYYAYYIYANLYVLNKLRESRGLNTFTFRCELFSGLELGVNLNTNLSMNMTLKYKVGLCRYQLHKL
jgi:hypothetical protein